jgi:lipopolysaccharide export LptBFGC system permease protein LptF
LALRSSGISFQAMISWPYLPLLPICVSSQYSMEVTHPRAERKYRMLWGLIREEGQKVLSVEKSCTKEDLESSLLSFPPPLAFLHWLLTKWQEVR